MQRVASTAAVLGVFLVQGCSGADHDALAARDASAGGGGSGGAVIEAGDADGGVDGESDASDGAFDGPLADSSFLPDGPSVFTFFHGMPDTRALRVCFEVESPSGFEPPTSAPLPDEPFGLPYGQALSASTLPDVDLETQSVRPVVYGGNVGLIDGRSCDQMDTLPEGVLRAELQAIPAGTLARGRSVLMVAAGCIGGPGHDDGLEAQVCGADFKPPLGNAALLVASMERTPIPGAMGLQVFAAALAAEKVTVDHVTASPLVTTTITTSIAVGQMRPRPPTGDLSVGDLGSSAELNTVRVFDENAFDPAVVAPLPEALARGGLSLDSLEDEKNYTLVVFGPRPRTVGTWFKEASITVIPSDP